MGARIRAGRRDEMDSGVTLIFYRRSPKERVWKRDSVVKDSEAPEHLRRLKKANPKVEFRAVDVQGRDVEVAKLRRLEVA